MGNYSIKNIALGIGIGLVISSVINISAICSDMSVEEIKKEASKHNLIVFTKEEILDNQTLEDTPSATPIQTDIAASQQNTTDKPSETAQNPAPAAEEKITVDIESGMTSERIADLLKEKGIIKDTREFLKRLGEIGKDDKLRLGKYGIPKGSSYDDIIEILTR